MVIEKKIDKLIDSVDTFAKAIKDSGEKLDIFEARVDKLEEKVD